MIDLSPDPWQGDCAAVTHALFPTASETDRVGLIALVQARCGIDDARRDGVSPADPALLQLQFLHTQVKKTLEGINIRERLTDEECAILDIAYSDPLLN